MATAVRARIPVQVSEDRLRAEIAPAKVDPHLLTTGNILERLKELGIRIDADVTARVEKLAELALGADRSKDPFTLAQGQPPVDAIGAKLELAAAHHDLSEDDRADFYESQIVTVTEGEIVGTFVPESPGKLGIDVFGKQIPAMSPKHSVEIGENIRLDADVKTLIATRSGKVHLVRERISVLDVVEIPEDVDFSTGNVDSPTDVLVKGTIRDSFAVKSAKSIAVRGAIEAAAVEAGGDVQVSGGIVGRDRGKVIAGGNITSKFCDEAWLRAGGDVTICRGCMRSYVHADGRLIFARSKLVGGFTFARQGAEIKVLGNEAEKTTKIAVGFDPAALAEIIRIDELVKKKAEACAKIRETIQPLLAQIKCLTPQQREKPTELMYQADEIEADIRKQETRKKELLGQNVPSTSAAIVVLSMVYPGVKVIFGDMMAIFRKERKGPIKIERRLVDRVEEICVIDHSSGSVTTMPSYEYKPEPAPPAGDGLRAAQAREEVADES